MMRTECLPDLQEKLDTMLKDRLRALLTVALCVLSATTVGFCTLLLTGERTVDDPRLVAADGSQIAWAIPVTPSLVLCEGELGESAQLSLRGAERIPLTKVRTGALPSGGKLTLYRATSRLPDVVVPVVSSAENGQRAWVSVPGQTRWEGALMERSAGAFEPQPAITLGAGLPAYSVSDRSLVGITAQDRSAIIVVSMSAVITAFPEVKAG